MKCPCCHSKVNDNERACRDCEMPMRHFARWAELEHRCYRAEAQIKLLEAEQRRAAGMDALIVTLRAEIEWYKNEIKKLMGANG